MDQVILSIDAIILELVEDARALFLRKAVVL
jgi:hypothetical protein